MGVLIGSFHIIRRKKLSVQATVQYIIPVTAAGDLSSIKIGNIRDHRINDD